MQKKMPETRTYSWAGLAGILLIVMDQLSKWAIVRTFSLSSPAYTVIPGVLDFSFITNRGAAFGIFANQRWIFISVTAVVIIAGLVLLIRKRIRPAMMVWAVALVIAGGIGNMIDRIRLAYVIDFIHIRFVPFDYIFNIDYIFNVNVISHSNFRRRPKPMNAVLRRV